MKVPRLTLFGRSLLLVVGEIAANAICWIVAAILFRRNNDGHSILGLALLSWHWMQIISGNFQIRSALIGPYASSLAKSAIDNATRGLINIGQLSVTCGLFFSLGHSTIVIVVNIAIAISADVYNRINGVGEVGGIVGAAVSGSFLFIIGLANTIILWRIIKRRKEELAREKRRQNGEQVEDVNHNPTHDHMLMMRILGPIITFVNRPWKMYPVGVLFGFGFDTASSIALIAISALAKKGSDGSSIPSGQIVILPLLFTAGMTLVDSVDSILMLYSYTGFPERSLIILASEPKSYTMDAAIPSDNSQITDKKPRQDSEGSSKSVKIELEDGRHCSPIGSENENTVDRDTRVKMNVMSGLSIILTLMSILVAFSISLITIMSLIGEQCSSCVAAAEADDGHGGGLAGRWWRGWARASEQSGYIGIAIVGGFLLVVVGWYSTRWLAKKYKHTSFLMRRA